MTAFMPELSTRCGSPPALTKVEIIWVGQRGVKFDGDWVFKQPSGQSLGQFHGKMEGRVLPEE